MALLARFLLVAIFLAAVYLLFSSVSSVRSSAALERDIARLSVYYVRALAREHGLQSPPAPSVDLERSLAVLLQSMLARTSQLELAAANNATRRPVTWPDVASEAGQVAPSSLADEESRFEAFLKRRRLLEERARTKCQLPSDWRLSFPDCETKLEWMAKNYKMDACYAGLGVDDSRCSHLLYLSEVENFCPRLPDLSPPPPAAKPTMRDLQLLLLRAPSSVQARAVGRWSFWASAAAALRPPVARAALKRVALFRGAAGPLGGLERRVWADVAAGLHALGHAVVWIHSRERLSRLLRALPNRSPNSPCPARPDLLLDLLVTDEAGRRAIGDASGVNLPALACTLRVIAVRGLAPVMEGPPPGLLWRQVLTAYPDLHDHHFLGFAEPRRNGIQAGRIAVVLGSHPDDFVGAGPFLQAVAARFPLHTRLSDAVLPRVSRLLAPYVPRFTNHAPGAELWHRAAVLVGLGSPLDPPEALDAMAHGVVFLNPRFDPPRAVSNRSQAWRVGQQHSYAALRVGAPWSVTVDLRRPQWVAETLRRVGGRVRAFLPADFTHDGYLRRLDALLRHHDLCQPANPLQPAWPPADAVQFYLAERGDSCEATCTKRERVCEPAFFPVINSRVELEERNIRCANIFYRSDPLFPAVDVNAKACHFQSELRRFSCFHGPVGGALQRICPCRDYKPGEMALCASC